MALDILYPLALFTIKSSLLLFYYRLTTWTSMRLAVAFTFLFAFASTVIGIAIGILTYTRDYYFQDIGSKNRSAMMQLPTRYNCAIAAATLIIGTDVIIWWVLPSTILPGLLFLTILRS